MTRYLIYFKDGTAYRDIYPEIRYARKSAVKLILSGMNVDKISPISSGHPHAQYINFTKLDHGRWDITIDVWNTQKKRYRTHILYSDGTISKY